jgi:hypothetical protein
MNKSSMKFISILSLVTLAIFSRWIPHLPNFTALGAAALLSGAIIRPKWLGVLVPLVILVISDAVLGFYSGLWGVYSAWVLISLGASIYMKEETDFAEGPRVRWGRRGVAAILASTVFFVVSNLGVWAAGGIYTYSLKGLAACYLMALPFFTHQIFGDLLFTAALFGAWDVIRKSLREPSSAKVSR